MFEATRHDSNGFSSEIGAGLFSLPSNHGGVLFSSPPMQQERNDTHVIHDERLQWSGEKIKTAQDYHSQRNFDSVATKGLKPYETPQQTVMVSEAPKRHLVHRKHIIMTSSDIKNTP